MPSFAFQVDELSLEELSVTAMRDSVALPETGASGISCSNLSMSCSSCCSIDPI
ncbi:thiazolylpeptide-type bacteriocin [Streptosporangium pseudovulgare]|uniref:Thiazolylpeptide-type bacteriocin n=1 Tax=Streptosporangium pseudovulgare TaxID=35765 RepID=A0ABQ2RBC4_9ACTN|nr:thiazolylpeptide-type bacteriocin [Streptosporangium pseudovulgare]GGQ22275.1 hypothetical protein GCM10010140_60690 [Streptosporangium pseudovulgare]